MRLFYSSLGYVLLFGMLFSSNAYSDPIGPAELCFPTGCTAVSYQSVEKFWLATATVPGSEVSVTNEGTPCFGPGQCTNGGYRVLGWAGPCDKATFAECPDIANQAFNDLRTNALRVHRSYKAAGLIQ